jgi:hypothetical protein
MSHEGQVRWLPLESNPEVLNSYIANMGVEQGVFTFQDVLSTDEWATDMVSECLLVLSGEVQGGLKQPRRLGPFFGAEPAPPDRARQTAALASL